MWYLSPFAKSVVCLFFPMNTHADSIGRVCLVLGRGAALVARIWCMTRGVVTASRLLFGGTDLNSAGAEVFEVLRREIEVMCALPSMPAVDLVGGKRWAN